MTKQKIYQYTSNKGTVLTTVDLEMGNPKILYQLKAEKGKILVNENNRVENITIPQQELHLWQEVDKTKEELQKEEEYYDNFFQNSNKPEYEQIIDILTGNET